jgi:hypothetical protein
MRKKIIKWIMPVIPMSLIVVFTACPDPEDFTDRGSEAAIDFCECYEKNTKEKCLENLKDKYESYHYMSDEFIESFNKMSTCGIKLIKEQIKSASFRIENKQDSFSLVIK